MALEPLKYRLGNPGITAISIDGVTHHVNPDGLLEVHTLTPNLHTEITSHYAGTLETDDPEFQQRRLRQQAIDEETERQSLFAKLDARLNRKIDRRRSVQQLREQWAQVSRDDPPGAEPSETDTPDAKQAATP